MLEVGGDLLGGSRGREGARESDDDEGLARGVGCQVYFGGGEA